MLIFVAYQQCHCLEDMVSVVTAEHVSLPQCPSTRGVMICSITGLRSKEDIYISLYTTYTHAYIHTYRHTHTPSLLSLSSLSPSLSLSLPLYLHLPPSLRLLLSLPLSLALSLPSPPRSPSLSLSLDRPSCWCGKAVRLKSEAQVAQAVFGRLVEARSGASSPTSSSTWRV